METACNLDHEHTAYCSQCWEEQHWCLCAHKENLDEYAPLLAQIEYAELDAELPETVEDPFLKDTDIKVKRRKRVQV